MGHDVMEAFQSVIVSQQGKGQRWLWCVQVCVTWRWPTADTLLLHEHTGAATTEAAHEYVHKMQEEGRYIQELWS